MTEQLHPQRASYPLVNTDDELVMVFRDPLVATQRPYLYLKALGSASVECRIDQSQTLDDRAGFVVLAFASGGTDTVTLTIDGGTPVVLTEATEFDAVISNEQTAINIAEAINTAATGLVATVEEGSSTVYVVPAENSGIKTFVLASSDDDAWTPDTLAVPGGLISLSPSQTLIVSTLGARSPLDQVAFLNIISGRLSVDLRSPIECRTYFRQPATLRATTGHSGGWPTSP